jgi:hypothetical protein
MCDINKSQTDGFQIVSKKRKSNKYKKYKKNCNKDSFEESYWGDPKGWIKYYHCKVCRCLMTRKDPSKKPQCIYSCGCIVCAKCIAESYFIKLNPKCPVENCNKLVNPKNISPIIPWAFPVSETNIETKSNEDILYSDNLNSLANNITNYNEDNEVWDDKRIDDIYFGNNMNNH